MAKRNGMVVARTRAEALENIREAITEYLAAKSAEIQGDSDVRSVQHEEVFV